MQRPCPAREPAPVGHRVKEGVPQCTWGCWRAASGWVKPTAQRTDPEHNRLPQPQIKASSSSSRMGTSEEKLISKWRLFSKYCHGIKVKTRSWVPRNTEFILAFHGQASLWCFFCIHTVIFFSTKKRFQLVSSVGIAQGSFPYNLYTLQTAYPPSPLTPQVPRERNDHRTAYSLTSELMVLSKLFL